MINSFSEVPIISFAEIFLCSFGVCIIALVVLFFAGLFITAILGDGDALDSILDFFTEKAKITAVLFIVVVTTLFWLILNSEIGEKEYSELSKAVSTRSSLAHTQELYKIAVADRKIKIYERIIIDYNNEKLKSEAIDRAFESKKNNQIEKTLKLIDGTKP